MRRERVSVKVFDSTQHTGDWPPEDLSEAIAWLQEKLDSIPEEHRATAELEISSEGGYEGSTIATISIEYSRPETDAEFEARGSQFSRLQAARRQQELAELARLRAKYEPQDAHVQEMKR